MPGPVRICDLCYGTAYKVICRRDRKGKPWNTVACTTCGLVGHEVLPSEQELAAYYESEYRSDYHGERVPSHRRVWRAWLKGQRVLRDLRPFLQPGERVFEVGAGLGCTVKVFELAGFDASGLEPGTDFQQYSVNHLRSRLVHGDLFAFCPDQPFDLVLLVHVIEHFRSPRRALQCLHRLVCPGGRLYLECPSLGKVHSKLAELFHAAHIHTFTPITLLTLLRQCGFEIEHCFSNGDGVNHKYLLRRVEPVEVPIDPAGYEQTLRFLRQYRRPWHRVRPSYLAGRYRRIRTYLQEYLFSQLAVARIVRRCQAVALRP
jgi:SAM-dependent methyltransferase